MKNKFSLRRLLSLCAVFVLSSLLGVAYAADPWDGTTLTEPQVNDEGAYVVTTGEELAWIANASNQGAAYTHDFVLANDIDLGGHPWTPLGHNADTSTKTYFAGNIDGAGYTIKGLYIETSASDTNTGFIGGFGGSAAKTAVIKNLKLEGNIVVTTCSNADIGSLIGFVNDLASIENCQSSVNITYSASSTAKAHANYMGGLVGRMKATDMKNCSYTGTISISESATMANGWGGLLGSYNSSTSGLTAAIENCTFNGTIKSDATAACKYGAVLVGYSNLSKGTVDITGNIAKGSMTVATQPTNYGLWTGKTGGTVNISENYTDNFVLDGEEQTTLPTVNPDPDPDPDPETPSDGIIRVLCIGNSFTVDAVEDYLSPICRSVGKKVIIGYPYKGGTTLEQHVDYINSNNAIYNYRKIDEEGVATSQSNTIFDVALKDEKWDYVVIQTDHNYSGVYDHYFPYLTNIMDYVKANGQNSNPKFFLYMTWAYDASSTYNAFALYGNNQQNMYNSIVECAYKAAEEAGISTVVPAGTAVQNCRTTYIGQNMNRDGYHMNFEYGRYTVGLAYAASVLGIDPQTVTYHPSSLSDNLAQVCKDAVSAALENPKTITSLAEKWGVNPDVVNEPIARKINLSLESDKADELIGTQWNVLDATDGTAMVENMIDEAYVPTAVKVNVNKAFTSETPGSLLLTGLYHGQTYDITLSYMLNGEPATIVQHAIAPDVNGRVYIDAETASAAGDGIDGLYAIVIDPNLEYTDATGTTVTLDPTSGIPERIAAGTPWDGTTTSEPALGAGNCYVINAAAELAWVAARSNEGIMMASMLIKEDLDLGGYKWTPIGKAKYYNGNIIGGGHTIKGLNLQPAAADLVCGFIGQTNSTSTIKDLTLEGKMTVSALPTGKNADYGTLVGLVNSLSSLSNCHSKVDIEGEGGCGIYQGGLVGRMKAVNIDRCSYEGNMTIATSNSKTKGYGGLVGSINSSVEDAKANITNSYVTGNIVNSSSTAIKYGAGLVGYANLPAGVTTLDNNYVGGRVECTGTQPEAFGALVGQATGEGTNTVFLKNYVVNTGTLKADHSAIDVTEDEMHGGALCYMLNADRSERVFGQDLTANDGHPVLFVDGQEVYKTQYMVGDETFATTYNNSHLVFPANPEKDGYEFNGWYDAAEGGNNYTADSIVDADATLYAQFTVASGIAQAIADVATAKCYTTAGMLAERNAKGIIISGGKKFIGR
jgi:uncharacterized repeat protein (TIGR02543 family)